MMKTDAVSGQSACDLLADPAFTASWQALYEQCPWATPFQCPAFVTAWYQIYARQFAPLIVRGRAADGSLAGLFTLDRKSTRLNSSHTVISYAVFCLKKKTIKSKKLQADK